MAYAERWYIEDTNPETGLLWKASIQERDYLGSASALTPDQSFVRISYKPIGQFSAFPIWHIASSICELHYIDDGTGILSDILNGDDEQFLVVITEAGSTQWTGFVQTDSFTHPLYVTGKASIIASDRLETLKAVPYMESATVFYRGREDVQNILFKALAKTGLTVGMQTHMQITPYLSSNPLDPATDDILESLRLDQDIFTDEDGLAYSCHYVIEQILMSLNLQLFQAVGEWVVAHRYREVPSTTYKVFTYSSTNTISSSQNITARETIGLAEGNLLVGGVAGGTIPSGKITSTYYHGNPFGGVYQNLGFEEPTRQEITGTVLVDGADQTANTLSIDGITAPSSIVDGMRFTIAGDTTEYITIGDAPVTLGAADLTITPNLASSPADNAVITFYESKGAWLVSSIFDVEWSTVRFHEGTYSLRFDVLYQANGAVDEWDYITDDAVQIGLNNIGGGADIRHLIKMWISVDDPKDLATGNTVNLYFDYKVGSYYWDQQNTTWTTTQPNSFITVAVGPGGAGADEEFAEFTIRTTELLDVSTPIGGVPSFTFYNAIEGNDAGGQQTTYVYIDSISIEEINNANEISPEATRTTVFNEGNVNRYALPDPLLIIGEGPSSAHLGRYTVLDSTGAEVETESSWAWATSDETEIELAPFVLNEMLRQVRSARRKLTCAIASQGSNPPTPLQQLVIDNPNNLLSSVYMWDRLTWQPLNPLTLLQGEFVEVVQEVSADKSCSYAIAPGSLAARGLAAEAGLSCSDGEPIFFPGSDFTHVYALTRGGIADGAVVKFERDDSDLGSGTWTETDLITFTTSGTDVQFMRVDEEAGYIFTAVLTSGDWDLYRHELDGSNQAVIYTSALAEEITGMDIDRVGQRIYLTRAATTQAYLTRIDYSGNNTDVYTFSKAAGGTFNGPMWDRSTKCYFFGDDGGVGASMFLYVYDNVSGTTSLVSGPHNPGIGTDRKYGVASLARGYMLFNPLTGSNGDSIAQMLIPAGASATYRVTSPNAAGRGCAVDWNTQQFFYARALGQVNRKNIDGTGDTHVATASSSDDIYDLCVGV